MKVQQQKEKEKNKRLVLMIGGDIDFYVTETTANLNALIIDIFNKWWFDFTSAFFFHWSEKMKLLLLLITEWMTRISNNKFILGHENGYEIFGIFRILFWDMIDSTRNHDYEHTMYIPSKSKKI